MSERFILNETSYFGRGSRVELAREIKARRFEKVLLVTDKALIDCGVTQTVKDTGCKEEDIEMLAEKAMEDPCMPGNPREVTKEDFIRLYKEAM